MVGAPEKADEHDSIASKDFQIATLTDLLQ